MLFWFQSKVRNNKASSNTAMLHMKIIILSSSIRERARLGLDLPPKAPSFITRVCGFGFHIRRLRFGQARRARSPQIAQALDALQRVFGFPMMSGV